MAVRQSPHLAIRAQFGKLGWGLIGISPDEMKLWDDQKLGNIIRARAENIRYSLEHGQDDPKVHKLTGIG